MKLDLLWERLYPYVVGCVATIAVLWLPIAVRAELAAQLANSVLTVVAILLGFVATSMSILLTAVDSRGLRRLRTSEEQYNYFLTYHYEVLNVGFAASIMSLVALVLCPLPITGTTAGGIIAGMITLSGKAFIFGTWVFLVISSFFLFHRVLRLLYILLLEQSQRQGSKGDRVEKVEKS